MADQNEMLNVGKFLCLLNTSPDVQLASFTVVEILQEETRWAGGAVLRQGSRAGKA